MHLRKFNFALIALWLSLVPLFGASLAGNHLSNPFPSEKELTSCSFSEPLSDNQKKILDTYDIYLVSIASGNPVWEWFGHTALLLERPGKEGVVYDYGVFNNREKNFYFHFIEGKMYYQLDLSYAAGRLGYTVEEDRSIKLTKLNLSPEEKAGIIDFLGYNATEKNKVYLYHFFKDNCATRIRDILDKVSDGKLKQATAHDNAGTYRSLSLPYMSQNMFIGWFLNFIMGQPCDKKISSWDAMFLPERLEKTIQDKTPDMFANTKVYYQETAGIRKSPFSDAFFIYLCFPLLFVLGLNLLFLLSRRLRSHLPYGILMTIVASLLLVLSLVLAFLMFFSDLDPAWFNENFIFVNPVTAGLLLASAIRIIRKRNPRSLLHFAKVCRLEAIFIAAYLLVKLILHSTILFQDNYNIVLPILLFYIMQAPQKRLKIRLDGNKVS
jgi:hypothetical protein